MVIVSQNGIVTIETLDLSIEEQYNASRGRYEYGIAFNIAKKQGFSQAYILGVYDTQRRAKEIQKEILKTYQLSELFKYSKDQSIQDIISDQFMKNGLQPFIYQMPSRNEN